MEIDQIDSALDALVRNYLALEPPQAALIESAPLHDYGLNSARSISLLLELETLLGMTIPDEFLNPEHYSTLASLRAMAKAILSGASAPLSTR